MILEERTIEFQIINKILQTKDIEWLRGKPYFDNPELFGGYSEEYSKLLWHYKVYNQIPDRETFIEWFPEFEMREVSDSYESLIDRMDEWTLFNCIVPVANEVGKQTDAYAIVDKVKEVVSVADNYIQSLKLGDSIGTKATDFDPFTKPEDEIYFTTGFEEIDDETCGISNDGELVGVLAKTNQGKTWILLKMATEAYKSGKNVIFVTTEMPKRQIFHRFVTLATNVSNKTVREFNVTEDVVEKYNEMIKDHKNYFEVVDTSEINLTPSSIENLVKSSKCDVIYIDGIIFVSPNTKNGAEPMYQTLHRCAAELSELSMKIKVPIVFSMQANRETSKKISSNKPPRLADISGSYAISFSCTKVFSIERYENELKILIDKSRTSEVGVVWVYNWDIDTGKFSFLRHEDVNDVSEDDDSSKNTSKSETVKNILSGDWKKNYKKNADIETERSMEALRRRRNEKPGKDVF